MARALEQIVQEQLGSLAFQIASLIQQNEQLTEQVAAQRAELIKWRPDPKPTFPEGNK